MKGIIMSDDKNKTPEKQKIAIVENPRNSIIKGTQASSSAPLRIQKPKPKKNNSSK